jgi:hypothetical protein
VQLEARVAQQPLLHLGCLVGGVVVADQVQVQASRDRVVDEPQELLVPAPPGSAPSQLPGQPDMCSAVAERLVPTAYLDSDPTCSV